MVILMNFSNNPFTVEYTKGNKSFVKRVPGHKIVAMKSLNVSDQISNIGSIAKHGATIWDYERGTYVVRNAATPTGNTSLQFAYIGNNVKPSQITAISNTGFSGTTTASAMTFTATAIPASTVFGFITSANTAMAAGTISATTIGNNRYISFSGSSTVTTANWYAAVLSGSGLPVGVTITGTGSGKLGNGSTFYLSASTRQLNMESGVAYLRRIFS